MVESFIYWREEGGGGVDEDRIILSFPFSVINFKHCGFLAGKKSKHGFFPWRFLVYA